VGRAPPGVGHNDGPFRGARFGCMTDIFISNEIWGQDKVYILIGTLLVEIYYLSLTVSTGTGSEI
jgi:hypothetical protein